jgi:hypothetical protein
MRRDVLSTWSVDRRGTSGQGGRRDKWEICPQYVYRKHSITTYRRACERYGRPRDEEVSRTDTLFNRFGDNNNELNKDCFEDSSDDERSSCRRTCRRQLKLRHHIPDRFRMSEGEAERRFADVLEAAKFPESDDELCFNMYP